MGIATIRKSAANDNRPRLVPTLDLAVAGQAITIADPRARHGRRYGEFVGHTGDGKHVLVRKLIASMWKGRWTKPLKVERAAVLAVHTDLARPEGA